MYSKSKWRNKEWKNIVDDVLRTGGNRKNSVLYFQEYFYKAFEQLYPDKEIRKHMCSIRAGNLKFLESHNVKYFEIKFRQRMNTHDPVHFYMEDQSESVNAIDKHLK